jgi:hypothetical protein
MQRFLTMVIVALACTAGSGAWAADVESLTKDGFTLVQTTTIAGDFDGCQIGDKIPLTSGFVFVCAGSGYMHATMPKVAIFKDGRTALYKLLINGTTFDGALETQ